MQTSSGSLPVSYSTILGAFHPGTKQPGREAGYLPLTLVEIRNEVEPYLHFSYTFILYTGTTMLYFSLLRNKRRVFSRRIWHRLEWAPLDGNDNHTLWKATSTSTGSDRRYGVTAWGRTSSMPQGVEDKKTNFKITLNFEHYVVLISHLGRVKPCGSEYSSLLWCYYLWVGGLLPKGYLKCSPMDIRAISFFETSVSIRVDMANYLSSWICSNPAVRTSNVTFYKTAKK